MPYTAADGVQVPAGTDAFSPPTQFKAWADKAATYHNRVIVASLTDRDNLTGMLEGYRCYVAADDSEWYYDGSAWKWAGIPPVQGSVSVIILGVGSVTGALAITFPAGRFASAPKVLITVSNVRLTASIQDVTTSGANIFVANWSGQATTSTATVSWMAVPN
jgi:hypothetical protein